MKRFLSLFLILITSFSLVACVSIKNDNKLTSDEIYEAIELNVSPNSNENSLIHDFTLKTLILDVYVVTWESNNDAIVINNNFAFVNQQTNDTDVTLTGKVTFRGSLITKNFDVTVLAKETLPDDGEDENPLEHTKDDLIQALDLISLNSGNMNVTTNFNLVTTLLEGYDITWQSNNKEAIEIEYNALAKVTRADVDQNVTLTASVSFNEEIITKTFDFIVLKIDTTVNEKTYFEDFTELINFRKDNYSEPQSEYLDEYDFNLNKINYDVINFRIDAGLNSTSKKVLTLGGYGNLESEAGSGFIRGNDITDGINTFEFFARLPFSPESTYPQVNGKDTANNANIKFSIYKKGLLEFQKTLKFTNNKEANKGKLFTIEDINITGTYTFILEISSGHRLSVTDLKWTNLPSNAKDYHLVQYINFDRLEIDEYYEGPLNLNDNDYLVSGLWSNYKNIHPEKELPFIEAANEKDIARVKEGYIYNTVHFEQVSKLNFMARNFGYYTYPHNSKIAVSYQLQDSDEWVIIKDDFVLSLEFKTYELELELQNVLIKIEVLSNAPEGELGGTANLDNIRYYK